MRTRTQSWIAALSAVLCIFALAGPASAQGELELTGTGVGPAQIGSTVELLGDQLGDEFTVSGEVRVTVDYLGHVVRRDGTVQFRAVKESGGDELNLFIVNNEDITTAQGVGPGMTIAAAEAIYGDANLTKVEEGAGREFVSFADQPDARLAFRTPGIGTEFVGQYGAGDTETKDYDPEGIIAAVWVQCSPGQDCPDLSQAAQDADADQDDANEATEDADAEAGLDEATEATDDADTDQDEGVQDDEETDTGVQDAGDGSDAAEALPRTGSEDIMLAAVAAAMVTVGGAFVVFQRYYLAPMWLRSRRW